MITELTNVPCPVCKSLIKMTVVEVANRPTEFMIMGPGGEDNFRKEISFSCSNPKCRIMFANLPEK